MQREAKQNTLQLSACADYRHADLALTREHKGLAVMHGIPREIAYRVSFALACIAMDAQA